MFANAVRNDASRPGSPLPQRRFMRAGGAIRPVVLFVEDHDALRFAVSNDLRDGGFNVISTVRAEEALAILRGPTIVDALLTDLRLPGLIDGWDIAEQARALRPDLPVIYASAYSYVTPRQVPGSVVLEKPYKPEALLEALDSLLS